MSKKLSLFSLVVLIVAAIDNMRNLPSAALFGGSLPFFFLLSALFFLIPTAWVSAALAARFPEEGGIYQWVQLAFGKKIAMAALWLQWINTMVWYPTMLSFIAGVLAYAIDPTLAQNKTYLLSVILILFWGLTCVNMKGIQISALVNNIFAVLGTMIPLTLLIILGVVWVCKGYPLKIDWSAHSLIPPLTQSTSWVSLIAIMAGFLGMELSGVHIRDIKDPKKNFPIAIGIATLFIFFSMLLGSLAIACVVPKNEINLISGVMQIFGSIFGAFGLNKLTPVLTILIVIGSTGTMINWLISPAKGLLQAAEYHFLPPFFAKKNRAGVAYNLLLVQAGLVTIFSLLFLFVESINASYWFLTALSTELYMLMYLSMFFAAIKLLQIKVIPILGILGSVLTIVVTFFPPIEIEAIGHFSYFCRILVCNFLTIGPLFFFYRYQKKKVQAIDLSQNINTG